MLYDLAEQVFDYLVRPFSIGPSSRLFASNWIVFLTCGFVVFALAARRGKSPGTSPLAFIFPREFYLHRSTLTDFKIYIANFFVRFSAPGLKTFNTSLVATPFCALAAPLFADGTMREPTYAAFVLLTILIAMANDLVTYSVHRLTHECGVLWPFHEVHHSAEVMTPLTLYRKHPFYSFGHSLLYPFIAGPVIGVLIAAFGQLSFVQILGMNMVYAIFNFAGANLRHSHIWISFGPILSRIFVSPAMHQIHHSIDPKHYNKNYGEVFALWDWIFGSLYIPEGREKITFGILDEEGVNRVQPHATLREAYFRPFFDSYGAIKRSLRRPASRHDGPSEAAGPDLAVTPAQGTADQSGPGSMQPEPAEASTA